MKIELWGRGGEISVFALSYNQYEHWSNLKNKDEELFYRIIVGDIVDPSEVNDEVRVVPYIDRRALAAVEGPNYDDAGIRVIHDDGSLLWEGGIQDLFTSEDDKYERVTEIGDFYFDYCGEEFGILIENRQKGLFETFSVDGVRHWNPNRIQIECFDIEGVSIITNLSYGEKRLEPNGDISTESLLQNWGLGDRDPVAAGRLSVDGLGTA